MSSPPWLSVLLIIIAAAGAVQAAQPTPTADDQDGDGLSDRFESDLLTRFAPTFRTVTNDCAGAPVEFAAGSPLPRATGVFGRIYGQAFPVAFQGRNGSFVELHYYHLWDRDCGRRGHPLDVEHVAALLRSDQATDPPEVWSAVYWYAAAHEATACDAGNGAIAARINADRNGPEVWVSRGKHASYLSPELCGSGCGSDSCESTAPVRRTALINIGERGAPMNGAVWIDSPAWRLNAKMGSQFTPEVIAAIEASPDAPTSLRSRTRMQSVIAAGNASADGIATGRRDTGDALATADEHTGRALDKGVSSVKGSLKRAVRAVRRTIF